MEQIAYEFPDEKEVREEEKIEVEIEVVDDTPEDDKKHVTPEALEAAPKGPPADVTDEELDKYTDVRLKDRLQRLGRGISDERRAKEAATRGHEEAIRYAQAVVEENKRLQGTLTTNQTALLDHVKRAAIFDVEVAKRAYRNAFESGDTEAVMEAQEKLTGAKIKADRVSNFKPPPLQSITNTVQPPQSAQQTPQLDDRTQDWQAKNKWFGENQKMTAYALGLHKELVDAGVTLSSDEYYDAINSDIRKRFPETFDQEEPADAKPSPRQKSNNVAPDSRSTAPKKIVLTRTQEALAKRLGLPMEVYARSVMELNRRKV